MCDQSAGNEPLNETEYTRSRVGDVNVEESGPVRADEIGPVRADEFGPKSADEDVVQEAEELKHVPAPILPSKAEVESHNVSHLPFPKLVLCVCPWPRTFTWSSQSRHENEGGRTDTDCICGLRVLGATGRPST